MTQMLVNTPTGAQDLVAVGPGGGYFDESRVLWDDRTDGPLPAITLGGMVRQGNALVFDQARKDQHDAALRVVPQSVTMRQARVTLIESGLIDSVEAAIDAIQDAAQRKIARATWDCSSEVQRRQPLVLMLAPAIGLSSSDLDNLFILAATK